MRQVMVFLGVILFSIRLIASEPEILSKAENKVVAGKTIAILDSGIDKSNQCLKQSIVASYDFSLDRERVVDFFGHGTQMAYIALTGVTGSAQACSLNDINLIDAKVISDSGVIETGAIIAAIHFSVQHGADVINMSFSGEEFSEDLQKVISTYKQKGIVFVAAAGNEGRSKAFYPAAYPGVVSVGAKNSTGQISTFSNRGDWVDLYLDHSLLPSNSGHQIATSELTALYSHSLITQQEKVDLTYFYQPQIMKIPLSEKHGYVLNSIDTSLFQNGDESDFLAVHARYLAQKTAVESIEVEMMDLQYGQVDKYALNFLPDVTESLIESKNDKIQSFNSYLLMMDMFSAYLEVAHRDEYSEIKNMESELTELIKLLDSLIQVTEDLNFKEQEKFASGVNELLKMLNETALATKGDNSFVAKTIRRLINRLLVDVFGKEKDRMSAGGFFTSASLSKGLKSQQEQVNKVVKYYKKFNKLLEFSTGIAKGMEGLSKLYVFSSIKLTEYLLAVESLHSDDLYDARYRSDLNKSVTSKAAWLLDLSSEDEATKGKFIKSLIAYSAVNIIYRNAKVATIEALVGTLAENIPINKVDEIDIPLKDILGNGDTKGLGLKTILNSQMLEKGWRKFGTQAGETLNNVFIGAVKEIATDYISIIVPSYMYHLYIEMILGMESEAWYSSNLGYLTNEEIESKALGSVILRKFGYQNNRLLAEMATTKLENGGSLGLEDIAESWEITESGAKYTHGEWGVVDNLKKGFSNPKDGLTVLIHNAREVIVPGKTSAPNGQPGVRGFVSGVYQCGGAQPECQYGTRLSEYFIAWDNIAFTISNYQSTLSDMAASSSMYDLIAISNTVVDEKEQFLLAIRNEANAAITNNEKSHFQPAIQKAIEFEKLNNVPVLNARLLGQMDLPIKRKDFFTMAMKILKKKNYFGNEVFHPLNPYKDQLFIEQLLGVKNEGKDSSGKKITEYFTDVEGKYEDKSLNLNEMIWAFYAKYNGVVDGNNGEYLGDDNVSRGEAFAVVTNLLTQKIISGEYEDLILSHESSPDFEDIGSSDLGVSVFKNHAAYLINRGLVNGTCTGKGNKRAINVDLNLTVYEAAVILFGAAEKQTEKYRTVTTAPSTGEKVDSCVSTDKVSSVESWFSPSLSSIPTVEGGQSKRLSLSTKIKEEDAGDYFIYWESLVGGVTNHERTYVDGYLKISVTYEAPVLESTQLIPVDVYIQRNDGESARKVYYINIVPIGSSDNSASNFTGSISSTFDHDNDTFDLYWSYESSDGLASIEYSFDNGATWTEITSVNQSTQMPMVVSVTGVSDNNKVQFRIGSGSQWSDPFRMSYESTNGDYNEKSSEIPEAPILIKPWPVNQSFDVDLRWRKVVDSKGNDNAQYYEVQYSEYPSFSNSSIVRASNTPLNANDSNSYIRFTINGLENEEKFYFKVRAVNDVGTGDWSNIEETYIEVNETPEFESGEFYPLDNSVGISKLPQFRWQGLDGNDDELIYYLRVEEDLNELLNPGQVYSQITVSDVKYQWGSKGGASLKPATTYYWQLQMKEKGRTKEYYGGQYPTSAVMSFTTENSGPDLTISDVVLLDEISPGNYANFDVTVQNVGSEQIEGYWLDAFYIKSTGTYEFSKGSNKGSGTQLQPGQSDTINVSVRFDFDTWTSPSGKLYDNILETGQSTIRFEVEQDSREANIGNNNYDYTVNYVDKGRPKFTSIEVADTNGGFYRIGSSYNRMVCYGAQDDILLSKFTVEYQLNPNSSWTLIDTVTNDDDNDFNCTEWTIPDDNSYVTENLRFRVKAYDSDSTFSEVITEPKIVYSNEFSGEILDVYLSENKVGAKGYIQLNVDSVYPVKRVWIELVSGRDVDVYDVIEIGQDPSLIEFTIPNDDFYASDSAYLSIKVYDSTGNRIILQSDPFSLLSNLDLPSPFNKAINLYPEQYENTEADVLFLEADESGVIHYLYEEQVDSVSSRATERDYLYRKYNSNNGVLSSPIKVADHSTNDSSGNYTFQNQILGMTTYNSKIYVIRSDSQGRIYMGVSNGNSGFSYFYVVNDVSNSVQRIGFIESEEKKLYLFYRKNADLPEDRRYYIHELSETGVLSARLLIDEYFPGYPTINSKGIYFSGSGKAFSFDASLNIKSSYEVSDDSYNTYSHEFSSDDSDDLFVFHQDQRIILKKADGVEIDITPDITPSYNTLCKAYQNISIINDLVYLTYCARVDAGYTNFLSIVDLATGRADVWDLGKVKDDNHFMTKVSTSDNGYVALGTLKKGAYRTPYLALGKFDVINKSFLGVDFDFQETVFEINSLNVLSWSIRRPQGVDISSIKLYESIDGQRQLLANIEGENVNNYSYSPVGASGARTLEVEVVDSLGNLTNDKMVVQVALPVTINNFYASRTTVTLGDTIQFNWSVTGGDANTLYKIYKKSVESDVWESVTSAVGSNSKSYKVDDFVGEYQFKLIALTSEYIWGNSIRVDGTLFSFDDSLFSPVVRFTPDDNNNVLLQWAASEGSSDGAMYTLFFKGAGESEFDRYNFVTQNTFLYYPVGDNQEFSWYVVATLGGYTVESEVFNVNVSEEQALEILSHEFTDSNGIGVSLSLSSSVPVEKYKIYRELNGVVEYLGNSNTGAYHDTELLADTAYYYYVSSVTGGIESNLSEKYLVMTPKVESYNVVLSTMIDGLVGIKDFEIHFAPSIVVDFEQYKISWGNEPSALNSSYITSARSFTFPIFDYATAYYIEVVGLDVQGNIASSQPAKLFFTTEFDSRRIETAPVVSASAVDSFSISLSWSEPEGVDGYNLYRQTGSDGYQLIYQSISGEYEDSNAVLPETQYSYKVQAFNGAEAVWSESISVNTPALPENYDSDNDGMPDSYELQSGLNPDFNSANEDADGDGQLNIDEYLMGSDLNVDDYPPLLTIPDSVTVDSTGVKTSVDLGVATAEDAKDGVVVPTIDKVGPYNTGRNIITWSASDKSGNISTAQQIVDVIPQVTFELSKSVREGGSVEVIATLNGSPVEYPVIVPFKVDGSAQKQIDHDLIDGQLVISEGVSGSLAINTFTDDVIEGVESIILTMQEITNAITGSLSNTTVSIYEESIAPKVSLNITQGGEPVTRILNSKGVVEVVATVNDKNPDNIYSFEWSSTSQLLSPNIGTENSIFVFDPLNLDKGIYQLAVKVTNNDQGALSTSVDTLVSVITQEPELLAVNDTDGDGISDLDEGWGDKDGDRIPDYADSVEEPNQIPVYQNGLAQTDEGTQLILGKTAFSSDNLNAEVTFDDLANNGGLDENTDAGNYQFSSGLYDFEIWGLELGSSVRIVLPQTSSIPEGAFYRKYFEDKGWSEFVVDENNLVHSAPGSLGTCPSPGDDSYTPALTEGHFCVQLTIEDGGSNDTDGQVNGVVKDPGGVAISVNPEPLVNVEGVELSGDQYSENDGEQVVMAFQLFSDSVDAELSSLSVRASGELDEINDIGKVTIYRDDNGNGIPEATERLSVSGYDSDDGIIVFELPDVYQLPIGNTQFLITYQF